MKITLISILLFTFMACSATTEPTETTTLPVSSDQILDTEIFAQAVQYRETEICSRVSSENVIKECIETVKSLQLIEEAETKIDNKLCAGIPLSRFKSECERRVKQAIKTRDEALNREKKMSEMYEMSSQAFQKSEIKTCDKIEDNNIKYACRYNILVNQAVTQNEPTLCSKIGRSDYEERCLNSLKVSGQNTKHNQ